MIEQSKDNKFLEESINDYYLLLNFLMKNHSGIIKDFQENILRRPIKSGLKVKNFVKNTLGVKDEN